MKQLLLLLLVPNVLFAQTATTESATTETTTTTETRAEVTSDTYVNESKTDDIGLGVLAGGPTTVTGKYWLNESRAIDFGAAFAHDDYAIIGTYLNHFEGVTGRGRRMAPYIGFGFYLDFNQDQSETVFDRDSNNEGSQAEDLGFGLRIPVGLEYMPVEIPIGIFAEISPGLSLTPDTDSFVTVGVGARYYW